MTVRNRAIFDVSMSAFLWGVPPLLIHYFAGYLDAHTQNFWRYGSAVVFLWIYGWKTGQPVFSPRGGALLRTLLTATLVVIYQCGFTLSLYYALPALISLLIQLSLVVAIVLSCMFFADERRVMRSPWFIAGACAALCGAVGMVVFSRQFSAAQSQPAEWRSLAIAVTLVSIAAVFWGAYSVAIKWCLRVLPPCCGTLVPGRRGRARRVKPAPCPHGAIYCTSSGTDGSPPEPGRAPWPSRANEAAGWPLAEGSGPN